MSLRVLLINPPQDPDIDSNLPSFVDQTRGSLPPLGLLYVAAAVAKSGHNVQVADCSIGDRIPDLLRIYNPQVVGITATTFTLLKAIEIAGKVRANSRAQIVLGGIHASIYPEETIKHLPWFDYVVSGEGEVCFPQLLNQIEKEAVPNRAAIYAEGFIEELDTLPMPNRRMTDWRKYRSAIDGPGLITTIMTSRGCPFNCVFCHRPHMGKRFRARSADSVMAELDDIKSLGIDEVTFYDDTFAVDRSRVVDICNRLISGNYRLKWDMRTRVDLVDAELLKLLRRAGCKQIRYGVEASSDEIMKRIGKGITIQRATDAIQWTREAGIQSMTYFIIGSPGETPEDWEQTIRFAQKLDPDYCYFSIMTPYPRTPLYDLWLRGADDPEHRNGRADHWLNFACNPRDINTPYYQDWVPRDELEATLKQAYRRFYLRPKYLMRSLSKVRSLSALTRGAKAVIKIGGRG
jgi:anaerobic magnesium-protoporphyrin IX monomethyl ester cyclase